MGKQVREPQALSVKRAQVEFHNFASLGEPERAMRVYREENQRRGAVIRNHLKFIGRMSPFLEIGANAGHTSYMLCNEFGAEGFARVGRVKPDYHTRPVNPSRRTPERDAR